MEQGQPDYLYPGQWADELGSAYLMSAHSAPALANDTSQIPMKSSQKTQVAAAIYKSQIPPYGPQS